MSAGTQYPMVVYLNQKYCFDLLAAMENGLAQLETIRTSDTEHKDRSTRFSGDVGVRDVFAFVGVKLGGERSSADQAETSREATIEKMHTPNSLFSRVRQRLHEEELVRVERLVDSHPGEFVEFSATLGKSPLVANLEGFRSAAHLASIADPQSGRQPPTGGSARGQQRQTHKNRSANSQADEAMQLITTLLAQLNDNGAVDLVGHASGSEDLTVVLTMDPAFLTPLSMSDVIDGEYRILGKVIKVLDEHADETINLLRKTSLGVINEEMLVSITDAFSEMHQYGLELPPIVTHIPGPALQLIPIAVFA